MQDDTKPSWMNNALSIKLRHKKEVYKRWKLFILERKLKEILTVSINT